MDADESSSGVRLRLLGPARAWHGAEELALGPPRQRAVLAALATRLNRVVSRVSLITDVWGEDAPASSANNLRTYAAKLRRVLGEEVLESTTMGYLLRLPPESVDIARFELLLNHARGARADQDVARAAQLGHLALRLWQGPVLDGIPGPHAELSRTRLHQLHATAVEEWAHDLIVLDRPAETVEALSTVTREHPFRERPRELLMRALHRSGRQADAVALFRDTRALFAEELGIDPGHELIELHKEMLAGGVALPRSEPAPAQLPADLRDFTGRDEHVRRLRDLARSAAEQPGTPIVISSIEGVPGVGKTALAVHIGHQLARQFPDGQLFVDLRGFTEGTTPLDAGGALNRMLSSVGVPAAKIPADLDDRAAMLRSTLANKRMLIVLDNAATEDQVRPLIPAASGCLVLITSRQRMTGLDSSCPFVLDMLPAPDAVELFTRIAGIPASAVVEQIVELCGRLPLAIRIAAARLRARAAWSPEHLLARMLDEHRVIGELTAGALSVRASFHMSYKRLSAAAQRALRLLGISPIAELDVYSAAALLDRDLRSTDDAFQELTDAYLVDEWRPGRFRTHDLVRAYAREVSARTDTDDDRRSALTCLFDHYLHNSSLAWQTQPQIARSAPSTIAPPRTPSPGFADAVAARSWFEVERGNITTVLAHCADHGWPEHAIQMAGSLNWFVDGYVYTDEGRSIHESSLRAARALDDLPKVAAAMRGLATMYWRTGQYPLALDTYTASLDLAEQLGSVTDKARSHHGLGLVYWRLGRFGEALDRLRLALGLYEEINDQVAQLRLRHAVGVLLRQRGHYAESAEYIQRTLALAESSGEPTTVAVTLHALALSNVKLDRPTVAMQQLQRASALNKELGYRDNECYVLQGISLAHRALGQWDEALRTIESALRMSRDLSNRNCELETLISLGETLCGMGRAQEALAPLHSGLELAWSLDQPRDQALAHHALATALTALGDDRAREHRESAEELFTRLGLPRP
ncbi:AfsR/SARP family transcriptional regulator [Allokutzneria oryzae]|uniref:Tetratricopeptide repeat protein n=1 Tax=Allokutzneria oryzae TaxID=1378989 RepID=A0ABV6A1S3_9PSEU